MQKMALDKQLLEAIVESTEKSDYVLQRDLVKRFARYDVHYVYLQIRRLDMLQFIIRYKRPGDGAVAIRLKDDYRLPVYWRPEAEGVQVL